MLSLQASRIGSVLILAIILNYYLASDSSSVSAFDLKRSLSMAEGLSALAQRDHHEPKVYASDDALITSQAKSNKVSKALRYLHSKSGEVIYKRGGSMKRSGSTESLDRMNEPQNHQQDYDTKQPPRDMMMHNQQQYENEIDEWEQQQDHAHADTRTDDEVIADACQDHRTRTCSYAVRAALKSKPEHKARIALALRRKPDYVDAAKLLYHKLFESAIGKIEESGIDTKLDVGLNLVLDKTPYGFMANQALNMATKRL